MPASLLHTSGMPAALMSWSTAMRGSAAPGDGFWAMVAPIGMPASATARMIAGSVWTPSAVRNRTVLDHVDAGGEGAGDADGAVGVSSGR